MGKIKKILTILFTCFMIATTAIPVAAETAITSVSLTISTDIDGKGPAEIEPATIAECSPNESIYSVSIEGWYRGFGGSTWMGLSTVERFESGQQYKVNLEIYAGYDYVFDTSTTFKVNNQTISSSEISIEEEGCIAYVQYIFTAQASKTAQTLTFANSSISKTYGDDNFTQAVSGANTTVTYSSSDTNVATVNSSTGEVTILKQGTTTIKASAAEDTTYAAAEQSYTLTVNKKTINVTADNKSSNVGSELVALTYTVDPSTTLCGNDVFSGALSTNANKDVPNTYTITKGNLTAGENYNINFTAGTYTVTSKNTATLTLSATSGTYTYPTGGTLTYTYDGDGTINILTSNALVATATANTGTKVITIIPTGAGTATITLTASEGTNYAATSATYVVTVNPATMNVTQNPATNLTYNKSAQNLGTVTPDIDGATIQYKVNDGQYSTNVPQATDAGTYTVGYKVEKTGYATVESSFNVEIKKCNLTITPDADQNKKYDGTTASNITYSYSGNLEGQTPDFTGSLALKDNAKDVGTYKIVKGTLALSDNGSFKASNYAISVDESVDYVINKRDITLTSGTDFMEYDGITALTNENVAETGDGWATGEGATYNVTGSRTEKGSCKNTFTYTAKPGTNLDNYNITKKEGYLIVGSASLNADKSKNVSMRNGKLLSSFTMKKGSDIVIDLEDEYNAGISAKLIDKVSGKETDLTCEEGSIKVTIPKSFINKLSAGTHKYELKIMNPVAIKYSYDLTITIKDNTITSNETYSVVNTIVSGTSNTVNLVSLLSLVTIAGVVVLKKKKH